jgi:hypothetical protein
VLDHTYLKDVGDDNVSLKEVDPCLQLAYYFISTRDMARQGSMNLSGDCNNRYNHVIRHHINTRPCCHDPILHNHVTLPAHVPEPVRYLTHAQTPFQLSVMALHQHAQDDHGVDDVLPRWKSSTPHATSQPFPKTSVYSLHCSYALLLTFTADHLIHILSRYVHHTHHLSPTTTIQIHKCPQPPHVGLPRRFWRAISWMQVANSFITYILSN